MNDKTTNERQSFSGRTDFTSAIPCARPELPLNTKHGPPLSISSFPQAIVHVDADAFFTSVEQSLKPHLRGLPVVTGQERGIIACASYEAKALGIKRGIPLWEARKTCPALVVLPSDYETYSLFSKRMFNIMRRYTPAVEEYSIDEAFLDITGMRRMFRSSYSDIVRKLLADVNAELGITVSAGLSISKSLAKLGSKFRKPAGFTPLPGRDIHLFLANTPLEKVWGFGPNSVSLLEKHGLKTALDFVRMPEERADRLLHKPGREIWHELRGNSIWKVCAEEKTSYTTITRSRTFTPASTDRHLVYAELVKNAEQAFAKARRYKLRAKTISIALRKNDFHTIGLEAKLSRATSAIIEAMPSIKSLFDRLYSEQTPYRTTFVTISGLMDDTSRQMELFDQNVKIENIRQLTATIDMINDRFGKRSICLASSLQLPENTRAGYPARIKEEKIRKLRFSIPTLNIKV